MDELQALLEAANRIQSDVLPMLAIGAFAGLRDVEIRRLDWSEVDLRARSHRSKSSKSQERTAAHYSDPAESVKKSFSGFFSTKLQCK